jgi:hypothetical protein
VNNSIGSPFNAFATATNSTPSQRRSPDSLNLGIDYTGPLHALTTNQSLGLLLKWTTSKLKKSSCIGDHAIEALNG